MSKVYDYVNEAILKRLEESIKSGEKFQWVKPWNSATAPKNFITKEKYKGINLLLLPEPGFYLTFKQLDDLRNKYPDLNLKLKKGCKKHMVVFWSINKSKSEKSSDEENEAANVSTKSSVIFKYYNVYNQKDIENFDKIIPEDYKIEEKTLESDAMNFIEFYSNNVCSIKYEDRDRACYNSMTDKILMPPVGCFKKESEFYSTCFHEMTHSTGHDSRLKRNLQNHFGDKDYSKEELVAEIGATILCANFGVAFEEEQSLAYLQSWLSVLKNETKLITFAAQNAQKAANYMLDLYETSKNQNSEKTA